MKGAIRYFWLVFILTISLVGCSSPEEKAQAFYEKVSVFMRKENIKKQKLSSRMRYKLIKSWLMHGMD